jgi:glycosyltransferase involved in cell wall biosynthesis
VVKNIVLVGKQMAAVGGLQAVNHSLQKLFSARGDICEIFSFRETMSGKLTARARCMLLDLRQFIRLLADPKRVFIFNISGIEILLFSMVCLLWRRDFYYWLHGDPQVFRQHASSRVLARFFFKRARAVVVLHRTFKEELNAGEATVVVIPNIVPQLQHRQDASQQGISRVVWVGRTSAEKNPLLALESMIKLALRFPCVAFLFISPKLSACALHEGTLPSNFEFVDGTGFVPARYFDGTSLHLFTSTLEAMPGVLFESSSCHARFVATRCSPWVDEVAALGHGIGVPVTINAEALVEVVSKVLKGELLVFRTDQVAAFLSGYNEECVGAMWDQILRAQ